ncbi:unnamed protein product [Vitrella brassicaformis CCMP3155]|uniref:SET domain-containing protein n=1 Tax=Vitrella brassicaformis (strain CCMP3155) TaxID=1169540 RepID=A0A0G4FUD5_VITBC|nr:unnamed protein product [Vitrella brassicaformis CCMP3155]|eukprot:CEM18342.1 unnamed protein product [Vitrella brassicaformis CCMP3155]
MPPEKGDGCCVLSFIGRSQPSCSQSGEGQLDALLRPQGFSLGTIVGGDGSECSSPANRQLASAIMCRTPQPDAQVRGLCREEGADADISILLAMHHPHSPAKHMKPISLLSLAIDGADSSVCVWGTNDRDLHLPQWPSHEVQRAVLEALIACGADSNGGTPKPLEVARWCGNLTAVEVLLKNGAAVRGLRLGHLLPGDLLPSSPRPEYYSALIAVYRRLLEHDPTLATEKDDDSDTPMHAALNTETSRPLPSELLCSHLDLLAEHGASLTARNAGGNTPLDCAVMLAVPSAVEWLCERLGREEINKRSGKFMPLELVAVYASAKLQDLSADKVDRLKEVIRVLLQHGASPDRMRADPHPRSLVSDIEREMSQRPPSPPRCIPPIIECPSPSTPQQQQQQQQLPPQVKKAADMAKTMAKKASKGGSTTVRRVKMASTDGGPVDTIGFVFELTGLQHTQWAADATEGALQTAMSAGRAVVDYWRNKMASPSTLADLVSLTDSIDLGNSSTMQFFLRRIAGSVVSERAARGASVPTAPPQSDRPIPLTTAVVFILALIKTDKQLISRCQPEERFALRQLRATSQATCDSAGGERVGLNMATHDAFGSAELPVVWAGAVGFREVTEACISMLAILLGGLSEPQRRVIRETAEAAGARSGLLQDAASRSTAASGGLPALSDTHGSQSGAIALASSPSSSSSATPPSLPPLPPSAHDGAMGKKANSTTTNRKGSNQPRETGAAECVGRLADEGTTGGRRGSGRHRQWMSSEAMDGEAPESPTAARSSWATRGRGVHSLLSPFAAASSHGPSTMSSSSAAWPSSMPSGVPVGDGSSCDGNRASSKLRVPPGSSKTTSNSAVGSHLEQAESLLGCQGLSLASFDVHCKTPTATSASASRELLCRTMCRTLTGGEVRRLFREKGADANTTLGIKGEQPLTVRSGEGEPLMQLPRPAARVSVLCLAVDDDFDSCPPVWSAVTQHLKLPTWPSRRVQRDVMEALVKCGADVNEGVRGLCPLNVAHMMANITATEVLLESGAAVRDEGDDAPLVETSDGARRISSALAIGFTPKYAAPSHPTPSYETALLEFYRRLFEYEPTLASRHFSGMTAMHSASQAPPGLSAAFMRGYLDLLVAKGASLDARTDDGNSSLSMVAYCGDAGLPVVEWLCERLGPDEINSENHNAVGLTGTALRAAAHRLAEQLSKEGTPPEQIDRQRQIIRTLLRYGADIGLPPPTAPCGMPSTAPSTSRSRAPIDEDARQPSSSSADTSAAAAASAAASASASVPCTTAERWKDTGNALFLADKYLDAYRSYLKGIRAERETLAELLIRRSQCLIGMGSYLSAFIDVTTSLRILPPPHSIEPGSKYAILQEIAMIVYKPLIAQLTGAAYNNDIQDVDLPSKGAIAALMTDAMTQLCSTDRPVVEAPQQVTDALTEGAALQDGERYLEAQDVFTAGLAAADVSTLVALLSNAAACLLKPELIKEGGPDAVGCAAAAFHLSCLKGPCQQLSAIQQKILFRLGQGLLAERLFDAASAVVQALTKYGLEGQMAADVTTLQRRIRTHAANASGVYDWAAIYRQAKDNAQNRQLGRTTLIDVAEYVGPVAIRHAADSQPSVVATQDVPPGQLLIVQKPVVVERASSQDSGRFDERLVARLASQCDSWHPRLVSQLCCLPPSRGQPSAIRGPPAPETCLGLPPAYFPLVPRFIWSAAGEEFGPPVAQIDSDPDRLRRLVDFNTRTADDIIETSMQALISAVDESADRLWTASDGLWPLPSLLSHAGAKRNAIWYVVLKDLMVVRAARPIARGNEVTVSYWDLSVTSTAAKLSGARELARRYDLPDPLHQYSPRVARVIEQVDQRLQVVRQRRPAGGETLRELAEMLQRVRALNVDTVMVPRLLALQLLCLLERRRVAEAVAVARESVASSRALLSYDIHDIRELAISLSALSVVRGTNRREALAGIAGACEVMFGTAEALSILYLTDRHNSPAPCIRRWMDGCV